MCGARLLHSLLVRSQSEGRERREPATPRRLDGRAGVHSERGGDASTRWIASGLLPAAGQYAFQQLTVPATLARPASRDRLPETIV